MRKFLLGIAGLAFGLTSFVNQASALDAAGLFNKGGTSAGSLVQVDDLSRETITNDNGDLFLDVGERLTGVAEIDQFVYTNGASSEDTGGSNSFVVVTFETVVTSKVLEDDNGTPGDTTDDFYDFTFGAVSGDGGVVASFWELPGGTVFDIGQDSKAALEATFTGGTHLFDLALDSTNGDSWIANAQDPIALTAITNTSVFSFDTTIINDTSGIFFANDDAIGSGRVFANVSNNNNDFEVANDVDFFFTITVPEPMTAGMGVLSLGALALRRRRKA